jgi:predicted O-methyltransferase YrrM
MMPNTKDFVGGADHDRSIPKSRPISPELMYVAEIFSLEDAELSAVRTQLLEQDLEYMSVTPAEGRVLQFLIRGFGIESIVEIGTLYGYSSLCMAKALPVGGRIISLEKDGSRCGVAVANARASTVAEKIDIRCGDALQSLAQIDGPVDMVFIDADKARYIEYLDWAEKNVRPGGLIVGDNTFLFGALWGEMRSGHGIVPQTIEAMQEFNRRLSDPRLYNSILIATAEGMTIAQKL